MYQQLREAAVWHKIKLKLLLLEYTDLLFFHGKSPWEKKILHHYLYFSLTLNFCITVKTQEIISKYGQTLNWPRALCSSYLMCLILCIFPLGELLGIKVVPVPRGMKSSMPRWTAIWDEAFQCLISLKSWLLGCSHHPPVHINKAG